MRLYHLTSANYALSNIALCQLKIARLDDLNDPFELLAAELSDREFRKATRSWKNDFHRRIGLLCFSENWKNPVLWSHYAEKHKGICLGFDVSDEFATSVIYKKNRVQVHFENDDSNKDLSIEFVNELLRTKYVHWSYEKEWRMFVSLDEATKEKGLYFYPFDKFLKLKEVIVGPLCETPIEQIEKLTSEMKDSIRIIKARLGFKRFEVVIDQRYELSR